MGNFGIPRSLRGPACLTLLASPRKRRKCQSLAPPPPNFDPWVILCELRRSATKLARIALISRFNIFHSASYFFSKSSLFGMSFPQKKLDLFIRLVGAEPHAVAVERI